MGERVIYVHGDTDAELKEQVDAARAQGRLVQLKVRRNMRTILHMGRTVERMTEGGAATVIVEVDEDNENLSPRDRLLVDIVRKRDLTSEHAQEIEAIASSVGSGVNELCASVLRQLAKQAGVLR